MVGPIADYEVIRIHDEGIEKGRKEGKKEGTLSTLSDLVKDGVLTLSDAAKRAHMSVEEFQKASANLNQ